jgi:hypothetical protein
MTWLEFRNKIIHESNLDYFLRASPHLLSLKYGMVWYGMVCGVVWCGVVWCDVVWCGTVWSAYHLAVGPHRHAWLLSRALLTCHAFLRFPTRHPPHAFVSWSGSLFASSLSTAWCKILGFQVTNKQTSHDPVFLEPLDCNKGTAH